MKKLLKNMKENEKGFTLIELIVVIAIIGILAAVLLPKFSGFTDDARKKAVMAEAKSIYTAYSAVQAEEGTPDQAKIKAYLGKLPKISDGTTEVTIAITQPSVSNTLIMKYSPVMNGKTYEVEINDGGDIKVTPK